MYTVFSASLVDTGMSKPANYTEETIDTINDNVTTEPTTVDSSDMPNIIFMQLETFIDPYELNFLSYSEDPIPNFHKLMGNYTSGYLTVPVVGAGTANTEFEVLTGMGIRFFGLGEYPYKTVLKILPVKVQLMTLVISVMPLMPCTTTVVTSTDVQKYSPRWDLIHLPAKS